MSAPNLKEIEWAISEVETQESSEGRYVLLAALHICRDHMLGNTQQEPRIAAYSEATDPVEQQMEKYGDSDFLQAVSRLPAADAWSVMDGHMNALRVVNPRAYESVMRKLGNRQ